MLSNFHTIIIDVVIKFSEVNFQNPTESRQVYNVVLWLLCRYALSDHPNSEKERKFPTYFQSLFALKRSAHDLTGSSNVLCQ